MSPAPQRPRRTFSASRSVKVQGCVLDHVKRDDDITFKDMARVLGRSEDCCAIYTAGGSAVDLPTFLAGCDMWGGRFANPLLKLAGGRWADANAVCTGDVNDALTLAKLLPAIIEVKADGIGESHELRPHEHLIRRVQALTTMWLGILADEQSTASCS